MESSKAPLIWQNILSYLFIMLLFALGVSTYVLETFYEMYKEKVQNDYQNMIEQIRMRNESELLGLINSSIQLASTDISPFIYMENPEKFVKLRRQLSIYASGNDFFEECYLIFDTDYYIYTQNTLFTLNDFANNAIRLNKVSPEKFVQTIRNVRWFDILPKQTYIQWGKSIHDVFLIFIPMRYLDGTKIGTIIYQVNSAQYDKMLGNIAPGNKNIYILNKDEIIFAHEVCSIPSEEVLKAAAFMNEDMIVSNFKYEGNNYLLYSLPDDKLNLNYLMIAPTDEISIAFTETMKIFVIIIAIIFIICLSAAIYLVRIGVKPIKRLQNMLLPNCPKGNEIFQIHDKVQKLINDNAMLNNKIETVEVLLKSNFVQKFISDGFADKDEWLDIAHEIHLNINKQSFVVGIIAKPSDSDYDLIPEKINHLSDDDVYIAACSIGHYWQLVFVAFSDKKTTLFEWLEKKLSIMRKFCRQLTMAVSLVHIDYNEGSFAYLEAKNAFENRFVLGNAGVIRFDNAQEIKEGIVYNPQLADRLQQAIKSSDMDRANTVLEEMMKILKGNKSLYIFRCMYNDILNVIIKETHDNTSMKRNVYDLHKLSTCLTLDELENMLKNICSRLVASYNKSEPIDIPLQVRKAMDIIRSRFSDCSISVSSIAQEIGISESRMSIEFKMAYNITPIECLTNYRMHHARKLLKTTNIPIKDIAAACGYYEITGFNRRFKAYTGKTPQQYRQLCREES